MAALLGLVGFPLLLAVAGVYAANQANKIDAELREQWKFRSSGIFDRAAYGEDYRKERSGGRGQSSRTVVMKKTIIYFTDGRTLVCDGRYDMPYPRLTVIYVYENGLGEIKILDFDESQVGPYR